MTTQEQLDAALAELAALKAAKAPKSSIKVSAKGAISVYGLGRFPVTLYASQWETLLAKQEDIKAFITQNLASLAVKGAQDATPAT